MGFVKIVKSKQYFSRFQTKFSRRRSGRTDYKARQALVSQDKNKFNTRKYRLIVRFSNKSVLCQVAYSTIAGDVIVAQANAFELPRYGAKVGLSNHAAAYATALLLGRRLLKSFGLDDKYVGQAKVNGEDYLVEANEDGPGPFKCILDTGLARVTRGAKLFTALKGALDAGICVPHSETRFVGYDAEKEKLDAATLRKAIFGGFVADYMRMLKEENPEKYAKAFSQYIKAGVNADGIEAMWAKVHAAIRADPTHVKVARANDPKTGKPYAVKKEKRRSLQQRRDRIKQKIATHEAKAAKASA